MAEFNDQGPGNMSLADLQDMVYSRLGALSSRGAAPEADLPAPAALPEQTAAPAASPAEATDPAGMEAEQEESGMTDNPFSAESRLAAARSALGNQRRIRENPPKDVY